VKEIKTVEFYKYFKDLKEYVELSNLLRSATDLSTQQTLELTHRIDTLTDMLNDFRELVYENISNTPEVTEKIGKKSQYFCTNKNCKHKFEAFKHAFLKVFYVCPRCKSPTVEMIGVDS